MEHEAAPVLDRPAEMHRQIAHLRARLDRQVFEQIVHPQLVGRLVEHEAHGPVGRMGAEKHDRLRKARIAHAGHGDEDLAGQIAIIGGGILCLHAPENEAGRRAVQAACWRGCRNSRRNVSWLGAPDGAGRGHASIMAFRSARRRTDPRHPRIGAGGAGHGRGQPPARLADGGRDAHGGAPARAGAGMEDLLARAGRRGDPAADRLARIAQCRGGRDHLADARTDHDQRVSHHRLRERSDPAGAHHA